MLRPPSLVARRPLLALAAALSFATFAAATFRLAVSTTVLDFQQPGTQPNAMLQEIQPAYACLYCHGQYDDAIEPYGLWKSSMMAQSMRDPLFHACLAIAEQDAPFVGDLCLRCHTPTGWLEGRSTPTDGSALTAKDYEGVSCNACHRFVDPDFDPAKSPPVDAEILTNLRQVPLSAHNGTYVVDPYDRRRGPFDLGPKFTWHPWAQSPFHQKSTLCATCHDVSNPALTRVGGAQPSPDDVYVLNEPDAPHPTQVKYDQFPLERTYSEWSRSAFAEAPIDMGGRFGGNKAQVGTCQDCHMPDASGEACQPGFGGQYRNDLPMHGFRGAATWVLRAVRWLDQNQKLYDSSKASGLTEAEVDKAIGENRQFLGLASDLELAKEEGALRVRVVNQTGHKLPSGYAEGRRMWVNVKFFGASGGLLEERGAYDFTRAVLDEASAKVYEAKLGLDDAMAALTGLAAGPSFHFALVNTIVKDNRIPPRGFTNAGFAAVQAAPVGASYADGQYWDDTLYEIPARASSARVVVYYQTSSKEYMEFLRDENHTNNAGRVAYEAWRVAGMGPPVVMDDQTIEFD
jgi:hypothetical protein